MPIAPVSFPTLPPLESGDKLSRAEFERRYAAMPQTRKAELVEGVVFMASPLRARGHGEPHARAMSWLGAYWAATPGVQLLDNVTVRLDATNEPQPDALLRLEPNGQSRLSDDDYVEGAPELIVEIAASSAAIALHEKLNVYRRNQVREYLVWRAYDRVFDWLIWREGEYVPLTANAEGIFCSATFPGLWLARADLLAGNLANVLTVVQQGIATPEHRAFVEQHMRGRS